MGKPSSRQAAPWRYPLAQTLVLSGGVIAFTSDIADLGFGILIGLAILISGAVAGFIWFGRNNPVQPEKLRPPDRIELVRRHLAATSRVLQELEDDLRTRTKVLEEQQEKAEHYEKLASLNTEQAQAIDDLVGRQFKRQGRLNAAYWWGGLIAAFVLGLVVNWLSAPLFDWLFK